MGRIFACPLCMQTVNNGYIRHASRRWRNIARFIVTPHPRLLVSLSRILLVCWQHSEKSWRIGLWAKLSSGWIAWAEMRKLTDPACMQSPIEQELLNLLWTCLTISQRLSVQEYLQSKLWVNECLDWTRDPALSLFYCLFLVESEWHCLHDVQWSSVVLALVGITDYGK